jgi:hypothetical protein
MSSKSTAAFSISAVLSTIGPVKNPLHSSSRPSGRARRPRLRIADKVTVTLLPLRHHKFSSSTGWGNAVQHYPVASVKDGAAMLLSHDWYG